MEAEQAARPAARDAGYFDRWYADMTASPARDAIWARALGLPAELRSTSLLPWAGIAEVADALRLPPGGRLVDLACGRGGYGIEVARRAGARLIGVDFSEVALAQARLSSARMLPEGRAEFRAGTLDATGLPDGAADGLMCVDAVQFSDPPLASSTCRCRTGPTGARPSSGCGRKCSRPPPPPDPNTPIIDRSELPSCGAARQAERRPLPTASGRR
jgi:hypothetical protein